jgi:hypothetical protein
VGLLGHQPNSLHHKNSLLLAHTILAAITSVIDKGDGMANFANPNAFSISPGPNISRAIESGFGMGVNKQRLDMQKQDFANQQSDREEMRNAMSEYGQATDREGQKAAAAKVGIVSPEMYARLEKNWIDADENQRKAMKENMDIRGNVAYMAMKEEDPEIWNSYVESLPDELKRAMPEYSPTAMKVTAAQSAEMMDVMTKLDQITAQGEKQKDVAGYQGSISASLKDMEHQNVMTRQQEKYNLDRKLEDKKMLNQMTEKAVGAELKGGSQGIRSSDAVKLAESRDPELRALGRQALGLDKPKQPAQQQTFPKPSKDQMDALVEMEAIANDQTNPQSQVAQEMVARFKSQYGMDKQQQAGKPSVSNW